MLKNLDLNMTTQAHQVLSLSSTLIFSTRNILLLYIVATFDLSGLLLAWVSTILNG